ncbi:MAG: hypothetical protein UR94_C0019G0006 [Parcubacteria group bacterium GW2011_GWA2_36_10]|nr:MAG: hypothetical protein UR94_C0019G0006 [Parcubacteria group bacterium GW2011_GWA2_36_10]
MKKNLGLTFVEVLLTISIAAIIAAMGFSAFSQWRANVTLVNQVDELKSKIIEIRQFAISAAGEKNWGIHFEAEQYIIFSGSVYNVADPNNQVVELKGVLLINPATSLANGGGGFSQNLIFTKFTGSTFNTGTLQFVDEGTGEISRTLNIDNLGKIN